MDINHYFIRWVHNKYWTVDKPQRPCCSIHNLITSKAKHAYNIQMFCIFIFCRMCIYNNNRFVDIDRSKPIEHLYIFYFQAFSQLYMSHPELSVCIDRSANQLISPQDIHWENVCRQDVILRLRTRHFPSRNIVRIKVHSSHEETYFQRQFLTFLQ